MLVLNARVFLERYIAPKKSLSASLFSPLIVRCNIRRGYALGRFQ